MLLEYCRDEEKIAPEKLMVSQVDRDLILRFLKWLEEVRGCKITTSRRKRLLTASFVAVRNMTGMNRKEFAEWLAIPYRTMQDWELGTSQVPEYVLRLVAYKVLMEKERGNL